MDALTIKHLFEGVMWNYGVGWWDLLLSDNTLKFEVILADTEKYHGYRNTFGRLVIKISESFLATLNRTYGISMNMIWVCYAMH